MMSASWKRYERGVELIWKTVHTLLKNPCLAPVNGFGPTKYKVKWPFFFIFRNIRN